MKNKILVFGGTTEGREMADALRCAGIPHAICVATEYGADIERQSGEKDIIVGRKTAEEMAKLIKNEKILAVVDATHPFATMVSEEISKACRISSVSYLRLTRDTDAIEDSKVQYFETIKDAAEALNRIEGNILLMTGSKDLAAITDVIDDISRIYARVLPTAESIEKCQKAGLSGKQIIAMQGPFSGQMNAALIRETKAKAIFTKQSGKTGGFSEKLEAAVECGVRAFVLSNPENNTTDLKKYNKEEVLKELSLLTGIELSKSIKKTITLAGVGPGNGEHRTVELEGILKKADVIFGAKSVIERLGNRNVPVFPVYKGEDILKILNDNCEFHDPLAVYSGDISLCSGALKASEVLGENGYEVKLVSGISSVTLFAKRLGISLEEVKILSCHMRKRNIAGYAKIEGKIIVLTSGVQQALEICEKLLLENGTKKYILKLGIELGTDMEELLEISDKSDFPAELTGKCLLYIENSKAQGRKVGAGKRDEDFIRGNTPMTKEEVRALSIRKLELESNSVLYDIGAGTGSVSVEAALLFPEIRVYSIEKNEEAVGLLRQNRDKFCVDNMHIVPDRAPKALEGLPAPTHVFIGGSGNGLREIVEAVRYSNPDARIVINCVTIETLSEIMKVAEEFGYEEPEIIQVAITRYKKAGNYHMPYAGNPVYVIRLDGKHI